MMKIRITNRSYFYLFAALVGLASGCLPMHAQSLGLAPAQVVEKFKPGVPFEFDLSTVNTGEAPVDMTVEITDFWYDDKNEKFFLRREPRRDRQPTGYSLFPAISK